MKVLPLIYRKRRCNDYLKLNKLKKRNVFKLAAIKYFDTKENTGRKINYIGKNWRGAPYEDMDYNTTTLKPDKYETVHINGLDEYFRYNNVLECVRISGHFSNYRYDDVYSMEHFKKCRPQIMPLSIYKAFI